MGVIINRIKLVGSKGTKKIDGLFDSGASFSFINYELAKKLDIILDLSEPIEFETAEEGRKITVSKRILLDFYIEGIRLSDEVIIGAATMQKWRLKLNFDQDRVIVDQRVTRPMLK